jgi:hypothetical protein
MVSNRDASNFALRPMVVRQKITRGVRRKIKLHARNLAEKTPGVLQFSSAKKIEHGIESAGGGRSSVT